MLLSRAPLPESFDVGLQACQSPGDKQDDDHQDHPIEKHVVVRKGGQKQIGQEGQNDGPDDLAVNPCDAPEDGHQYRHKGVKRIKGNGGIDVGPSRCHSRSRSPCEDGTDGKSKKFYGIYIDPGVICGLFGITDAAQSKPIF